MCELEHLDGIVPGSRVHRRGGLAEGVTRLLAAYEPGDVRARRLVGRASAHICATYIRDSQAFMKRGACDGLRVPDGADYA